MKRQSRAKFSMVMAVLIALVISVGSVAAFGTIVPDVWQPTTNTWINGNADGYSEGEVVPIRYQITDTEGTNDTFSACLDMTVSNNGAYGFSDVEPWDTDYLPTVTPPVPGNLGSVVGDGFQIENGTINSASFEGLSDGNAPFLCPPDYLEWALDITLPTDGVGSDDETATVVYGAKLAAPGDTTANGATVPAGLGAAAVNGTFQVQLANGGSETINFRGPDIAPASGGQIVVIKDATPADGTDFDFTLTEANAGLISQFKLDDAVPDDNDGIDDTAVFNVPTGTYTLDELTPAGWTQTGLACTSDDGIVFNYQIDVINGVTETTVEFPLGDGEQAVCTFTNTGDATVTVIKDAIPDDPQDFAFNFYGYDPFELLEQFSLDDDGDNNNALSNTKVFSVAPGRKYGVSEAPVSGWELDSLVCTSSDSNRVFDGISFDPNNNGYGKAFSNLAPGEAITCTFTNVKDGKIIVGKYHDLNQDSKWQTNDEPGLQGWTFNLYLDEQGYALVDTKVTGPNGFVTFSSLTPGADYKICEVLQPNWINTQADTLTPGTSPGPTGNVNEVCSDVVNPEPGVNYQARFGNYERLPVSFCPVDPNVGFLQTDVLGSGMGGPNVRAKRTVKLVVPDYQNVAALYGQLAAVDVGQMRFARFRYPDTTYIQINDPTSPAFTTYAINWWGSDLDPSPYIKGQLRWRASASRSPRAFVLWPTYNTQVEYANVFEVFDDSSTNHVFWDESGAFPWIAEQTQTLVLPKTQTAGADILVKVALVDNNPDNRPVILTVSANGVVLQSITFGPNKKDTLNLEEFLLENVPAGTSEVVLHLLSPAPDQNYPDGGDSVAMIGATASYLCPTGNDNGRDPASPSPVNTGR